MEKIGNYRPKIVHQVSSATFCNKQFKPKPNPHANNNVLLAAENINMHMQAVNK